MADPTNFTPPISEFTVDAFTKILLHFNGPGAIGVPIVDDVAGHTWQPWATLTAVPAKFGSASIVATASSWTQSNYHADFVIGMSEFCVDFWVNFIALPTGTAVLCEHKTTEYPAWFIWLDATNNLGFISKSSGGTTRIIFYGTIAPAPVPGTWYHVAITATTNGASRDFRAYWNGNQVLLSDGDWFHNSTWTITPPTNAFNIGRAEGYNLANAYIDEFRLSVGTYRWPVLGPTIALSTGVITNACYISENATPQTFEVWNSDSDTLNYTISDDVGWLTCMPTSGSLTGADFDTITVNYNTSALAIGVHTATITVTDPDAGNSPQTINVTLNVVPPDPSFYMHGMKWFSTGLAPFRGPEYKGCYLGCRP